MLLSVPQPHIDAINRSDHSQGKYLLCMYGTVFFPSAIREPAFWVARCTEDGSFMIYQILVYTDETFCRPVIFRPALGSNDRRRRRAD